MYWGFYPWVPRVDGEVQSGEGLEQKELTG